MDNIQILAAFLLLGRILAVKFLVRTAGTQIRLLRLPIDPEIWDFRRKLHYMTLALLVANIPSIILDVVVMLGVDRTTPYLVAYALSNMVSMVIAAYMIDQMYRLANNTKQVNDLERVHAQKKYDKK